jgi:hypothetical protein
VPERKPGDRNSAGIAGFGRMRGGRAARFFKGIST